MFSRKVQNQTDKIEAYLELIPLPKLTNEQTLSCEGIISEDEVFKSLKSMENNKSPGNDGLSKEFYECFWDEVKKPFLASIHKAFLNQELSTSQKMLGKKDKDKRFIKNWRLISLLNTKHRCINEIGRVISDILEIAKTFALEGFLVKIDIEKAFDSVNHCFFCFLL